MKYFFAVLFSIKVLFSAAQSVNAPLNEDYYHWIDRYEIQSGKINPHFHSSWKAYQRENIADFIEYINLPNLSRVDEYNIDYLLNDNWEWADSSKNESKRPILKHFYKVKSDFYHVNQADFDLHINPVFYFGGGRETANNQNTFINTRGVEVRGMVDKRVSFYSFIGENQIIYPEYVREGIAQNIVVPQEGFWKGFKDNGVDFFTARGYLSFNATKHINLQFGHDRFKIGNGDRSMILSDNVPAYLFLKMNTQVWRIKYTNLYTQLTADIFGNAGGLTGTSRYPSKYMSLHHLSLNVSKKLNVGLFESVIFSVDSANGGSDFDMQYLNPIIFYRSLEQQNGSPDNALLGMDFKWLPFRGISIYGQVVLDEFLLENLKEGDGWWANKYGFQLGGEYINAFGIKNLDLQLETNISRPYTYSHGSPYGSYSHYEQSLAHPLGANFKEVVGVLRFQPFPRLNIKSKLIMANYGADGEGENWGSDILKNNSTREMDFGNEINQGVSTDLLYGNLTFSYMLRHNVFIDLSHTYRKLESEEMADNRTTHYTSGAIRWNIPQRLNEF